MKIIIFGSSGMLGFYCKVVLEKYYDVIVITREEFDAKNPSNLREVLSGKINNQDKYYVINCVGLIPQRFKSQTSDYVRVNSIFPHLLNVHCESLGMKLIHITTDCVFDGSKGNYKEGDEHTERNLYGISKSAGEGEFMCIRTSIIGEEKYNKKSLLEWVKSNKEKEVSGFAHHYWNGMTCLQLSKIIQYIIQNDIKWKGVRHLFSPRSVSKCELIKMIDESYNLHLNIRRMTNNNNVDKTLSSNYEIIVKIPDISEQIKELKVFGEGLFNEF